VGDEERVGELQSTMRPYVVRRQDICRQVAPKEDLQRVVGWNDFFATAVLSVVVDEELCKTNACTTGKGMCPKSNIMKPYYGAENELQPPVFLSKMFKM
jgi:hypothetical protein